MKYIAFPHYVKIESKKVKTYGIVVLQGIKLVKIVKDVTTDHKAVKQLVRNLNKYRIEIVHLDDVLEDFFYLL